MIIIDKIISVLFVAGFILLPIFVIMNILSVFNKNKVSKRIKFVIYISFITPILGVFLLSHIMSSSCYEETINFLTEIDGNPKISINASPADNNDELLSMLKGIKDNYLAHHSHPTKSIKIKIEQNGESLSLVLRRDSQKPHEYWVFNPQYEHTSANEIARVTTSLLDNY